jgi:secretion/DNA translocation related TadE-like protein
MSHEAAPGSSSGQRWWRGDGGGPACWRDRGSGTVLALALSLLIGLGATAGVARGLAVAARHRANAAADLAALAGAAAALDGPGGACTEAGRVARANGGRLDRCVVTGEVVEVRVARALALGRLGQWTAVGRARAGPVTDGHG